MMTLERTLIRLRHLTTQRPHFVLTSLLIVGLVSGATGVGVISELHVTSGEIYPRGSESYKADIRVERATGMAPAPTVVALLHTKQSIRSIKGMRTTQAVVSIMATQPGIAKTISELDSPLEAQPVVSYDHHWTVIAAVLRSGILSTSRTDDVILGLKRRLPSHLTVILGGSAVVGHELAEEVRQDLKHIELWVLLMLGLMLICVFRNIGAAMLPLIVGVVTVAETLAALRLINQAGLHVSLLTLPVISGLGLGLAIDYSLLFVARFREEAGGLDFSEKSLRRATSITTLAVGRTIAFSAVVVASSFVALMVFPIDLLPAAGVGGGLCAIIAAANSLLLLPAATTLFGERFVASKRRVARARSEYMWHKVAYFVTRRRILVAVSTSMGLVALSLPAANLHFKGLDADSLPSNASARRVATELRSGFEPMVNDEILTLVLRSHSDEERELYGFLKYVRGLHEVRQAGKLRLIGHRLWELSVLSSGPQLSTASRRLVKRIRERQKHINVEVTSATASFLDQQAVLRGHLFIGVLIVALATFIALFAMTRSVVIPVKALLMSMLTFSATFGLLVVIFQEGALSNIFGTTGGGAIELMQPILMFGAVCGLSTDYNIFVLSRIQEARKNGSRSEREAIAVGLARSGPVVTAAALVFCVTVATFGTSNVLLVKETAIGMAIAVGLDAAIVRPLLLPSLMAILGKYNWWRPTSLRWPVARRLRGGFGRAQKS